MSIYFEILKHGHWDAFLEYIWEHGDFTSITGSNSSKEWSRSHLLNNNFDTLLVTLFEESQHDLFDLLSKYFKEVKQKKSCCSRCTNILSEEKENPCSLCGWNSNLLHLISKSNQISNIECQQELAYNFVKSKINLISNSVEIKSIDEQATLFSKESEELERKTNALSKELNKNEIELRNRENLEQRFTFLTEEIQQLKHSIRNSSSLFHRFEPSKSKNQISLQMKRNILTAIVPPEVELFPIDIIMGLQDIKDKNPTKMIMKTSCFIFIPKTSWEQERRGRWSSNLNKVNNGIISGSFYTNFFSYLHKKDHKLNIRYDIKRIIL